MNQRFDENEPIQMLVAGRNGLIDQALTLAKDHLIEQEADDIALVAVGGYGHGALHPHPDIDILILLHNESGKRHQRAIEQFLTSKLDPVFAPLLNVPSKVLLILLSSPL